MDDTRVSLQQVTWPDGSKYEGLVKQDMCHLRGVSKFADGDRYAGEFLSNCMEGFGVYYWHDGTSYKGAWHQDKMHGCGIKLITDDSESIEQAGQFIADDYVGPSNVCSVATAQQAARQALAAAHLASGLQEREGVESLQLRRHQSHQGRMIPSHASAFEWRATSCAQSPTLQTESRRNQQ